MKKYQVFILGAISAITAVWSFIASGYIGLVVRLGWKSMLIFPFFWGAIAAILVFIFQDAVVDPEVFIEDKVKSGRVKKLLTRLFKGSMLIALPIAAFFLCPLFPPILARLGIKDTKIAYLVAIFLNVVTTMIWIPIYLLGWGLLKAIIGIN